MIYANSKSSHAGIGIRHRPSDFIHQEACVFMHGPDGRSRIKVSDEAQMRQLIDALRDASKQNGWSVK